MARTDLPAYKRPESVLVVVYTQGGEVLMLRRRRPAWFWQSVTGSLEPGETPRQAAERELFEETGLCGVGRLVDCHRSVYFPIIPPWRGRYAPGTHLNREHRFRLQLSGRRTVRPNPHEHFEARWLPDNQALRRAGSWTNRQAILELSY
jgi:dATP pyrophosphohydrolase